MSSTPMRALAFAATAFFAVRTHLRVLRKRAEQRNPEVALSAAQAQTGLDPEGIALYTAIAKHEGFSRAGVHKSFAHLARKEAA